MGKAQETRKKIVETAVALAKKFGPESISVKQIYEHAGISKNTFYLYFNNKDEVFGYTYSVYDDDKVAALPEIMLTFDSPLEQFWAYSKIDIERHISYGPKLLATITFRNVLSQPFDIENEDSLSPSIKVFLSMIKKMQRTGEIANQSDAFLLLKAIYDCVIGIDLRWTKMAGAFDFKQEVYNHMVLILQPTVSISNY